MKKSQRVAVSDMLESGMELGDLMLGRGSEELCFVESRREKVLKQSDENYSAEMIDESAEMDELVRMNELSLAGF